MANKFLYTFLLFAYIVGVIGGIGYTTMNCTWFVIVCILILAVMAAFQEWIR
jgi:hypothetical protein